MLFFERFELHVHDVDWAAVSGLCVCDSHEGRVRFEDDSPSQGE